MNIASTSASSAQTANVQSIQVLKKAQDLQKAEGRAAVSLIQASADIQKQAAPRQGGSVVDVYA